MIRLHYFPSNASFAPHVLLNELGVPFELVLVDRGVDAQRSAAYLALNPNGQIPTLEDGDLVIYETAAICLHLADTHPTAGLVPPLGTAARAQLYKWLAWLTNTVQPMLMHYYYPSRMVDDGDAAAEAQVKAHAERRVVGMLPQLDALVASHGGPWLLGSDYSALDPIAFMLCRWTRNFATRRARDFAHLGPYLARMVERPAVQRAIEVERLPSPVY